MLASEQNEMPEFCGVSGENAWNFGIIIRD
jgi:hypothetical protein